MVHGNWITTLTNLHSKITKQIQDIINQNTIPPELCKGRTVLIQKDINKGTTPSNYRRITRLPMIYKLITSVMKECIQTHIERKNIMPLEQKGCLSRFRGCKDHLLLDKTICTHAKSHKRNLTTAWLDMRKAYDSIH